MIGRALSPIVYRPRFGSTRMMRRAPTPASILLRGISAATSIPVKPAPTTTARRAALRRVLLAKCGEVRVEPYRRRIAVQAKSVRRQPQDRGAQQFTAEVPLPAGR